MVLKIGYLNAVNKIKGLIMGPPRNIGEQIVDLISEEIGILAQVVFDETLKETGINESDLSRRLAGKFVRVLDEKLPRDMTNKQKVIREVGKLLIKIH